MKLVEILQGKWLGHPLHPAIVHVPLGAWIATSLLDLSIRLGADSALLPRLSTYALIFGLAGVLIAAPAGIADWVSIKRGKPAWKIGLAHMGLNVTATALYALNLALRFERFDRPESVTGPVLALSITGALLLIVSGYLGSLLSFDHGISVARLSKKSWRERARRGGSNLPEET